MSMNEKIKALYGQYEKILQNYEAIKSMNLDQQTKEIVKNDLQKRCKKIQRKNDRRNTQSSRNYYISRRT